MFRLVDKPKLLPDGRPGQTLIGSTSGPVVDTGILLRPATHVYVSAIEADEIVKFFPDVVARRAEAIGWASPAETAELTAVIRTLTAELDAARAAQTRVVPIDELLEALAGVAA